MRCSSSCCQSRRAARACTGAVPCTLPAPRAARHDACSQGARHSSARTHAQGADDGRGTGAFRFWTDERRFKGPGAKCVVQEALFEAGARCVRACGMHAPLRHSGAMQPCMMYHARRKRRLCTVCSVAIALRCCRRHPNRRRRAHGRPPQGLPPARPPGLPAPLGLGPAVVTRQDRAQGAARAEARMPGEALVLGRGQG